MQGEHVGTLAATPQLARLDALTIAQLIASTVPVSNGETVASRTRNVLTRAVEIHDWLMTGEMPRGHA